MNKLLNFLLIVLIFTVLQVTNVGAQDTAAPGSAAAGNMNQAEDCMQHPASTPARENCQNRNAAPGSAAAGNMNQAEDCMQHPASTPARENCQNRNAAPGSAAAGNTTSSGGLSGWVQGGLNALGFGAGEECVESPAWSCAGGGKGRIKNGAVGGGKGSSKNGAVEECVESPAWSCAGGGKGRIK
jgi:hypothetical protein